MLPERLVQKITGTGIDVLVLHLHNTRARVYDLGAQIKVDPKAKTALEEARIAFALAESSLEKAKAEHAGLVALTQLLAAMTAAGQDVNPIRLAMVALLKDDGTAQAAPTQPVPAVQPIHVQEPAKEPAPKNGQAQSNDGTDTGTFMVLEVRPGKSQGTVRAFCQTDDGNKYAVYAKNGNGQVLAGAVGKQVEVKYRMGDKGLIALSVRMVA